MVNKWIGIGNLTADPEMKYLGDGTAVVNFSVACNEKWTKDGEKKERVEFVRIVAWRRLAEICGEYLAKGSRVYIEGKLQTSSWEKDGVTRYKTEVVANEMKMLSERKEQREPKPTPPKFEDADGDIPY